MSRTKKNRLQLLKKLIMLSGLVAIAGLLSFFVVTRTSEKSEVVSRQVDIKPISIDLSVLVKADEKSEKKVASTEEEKTSLEHSEKSRDEATSSVDVEQPITVTEVAYHSAVSTETPVVYGHTGTSSIVLANGNSAGEIGSAAAAQMAAATGVPQETWEYIIARESNGDPNAYNPSGASGLFQTMPGWGSTATVQDQIDAAVNAYNNQGLAAWGM